MKTLQLIAIICSLIIRIASGQKTSISSRLDTIVHTLEQKCGGVIGVGVLHIESGEQYFYNDDTLFPMASTLKIPVAVQLLNRVEKGEISLSDMVEIKKTDLHPGSGIIVKYFEDLGISVSIKKLMQLMLIESDNSATDLCIKHAGGTKAISANLKEMGISEMSVDRPTYVALCEYMGVFVASENEEYNDSIVVVELKRLSRDSRAKAAEDFENNYKDCSSPRAMLNLLEKIWSGKILNSENSDILLDALKNCNTGNSRIKELLPQETIVYHKTGTIGNITNDVGIIELPYDSGNIAIVVFIKGAKTNTRNCEEIIAESITGTDTALAQMTSSLSHHCSYTSNVISKLSR